jgi:hypothetical protein
MSKDPKSTGRLSAHSRLNETWLIAVAILLVFLSVRQPIAAQTADVSGVVVTAEAPPTPTPHDNFREMRQHIMPEVAGTEITVTKNRSFSSKPLDFSLPSSTRRDNSISIIVDWVIRRNRNSPLC